jgi:hypothetical protein
MYVFFFFEHTRPYTHGVAEPKIPLRELPIPVRWNTTISL